MNCNYSRTFIPNMFWEKCSLSYKSDQSGFLIRTNEIRTGPTTINKFNKSGCALEIAKMEVILVTEICYITKKICYQHRDNQSGPKHLRIHLFPKIFVTNFWKGTGSNLISFLIFHVCQTCVSTISGFGFGFGFQSSWILGNEYFIYPS